MIEKKLTQIEEGLKKMKAPVLGYFNAGIDIIKLEKVVKDHLNIEKVDDEIVSLYKWHDGTSVNDETSIKYFYFFSSFYLNSIEDVNFLYEHNLFQFIENKMFPLCSSGDGDHLAYEFGTKKIYCIQPWNPDFDTYVSIYDSLDSMLDTILHCYKKGLYYISENGLEMDFDGVWEVSQKRNPKSAFWKC
ncbi:SMI1/KNR4 family protein [uncultured Acetobacteroides sp.]|uniref:SMI1/KNR4 family protein n=1 Tax=uncultured Acetobacteroides sp. TaxID=1760811 RepID=UPI0029F47E61|nr:SMI1/KNR4 family protein [uncultured Acetobacteroides sp.]